MYTSFKIVDLNLNIHRRKEIESLSDQKKGWHKSTGGSTSQQKALVLQNELQTTAKSRVLGTNSKAAPKTSMEFQRNWKRLPDVLAKLAYLLELGSGTVCGLLRRDDDAEVFEDILLCLCSLMEDSSGEAEASLLEWLQSLTTMERFGMLVHFIGEGLRLRVKEWLVTRVASAGAEGGRSAAELLAERYSK